MAPQVPTAVTIVHPAWQSGLDLTKYIYKKSIWFGGRFYHGTPCWDAALDAAVLTWEHPSTSRACQVRHVTVSFPESVGEEEALERLPKIIAHWVKKYAPDREWVAGIHRDNGKYHAHIAIQNVRNGKPLRLLPHQVVEMSRMGYTDQARDAKGVGSPGLKFYSKTAKPLLADVIRSATKEQLNEWIEAGRLRVGRVDKKGNITSVEFDGGDGKRPRRIRLDTLRRLTARRAAEAPGDSQQPQGPGTAPGSGLDRRGRPGRRERSARPRSRRHLGGTLARPGQQDSSLLPQRGSRLSRLQRDCLPGGRLAKASRHGPAPGAGGLVAPPVRGLARFTSSLTPKKKEPTMPMQTIPAAGPLPEDLLKKLADGGLDPARLDAARQQMEKLRQEQRKEITTPDQTPKAEVD